MCFPAPLLLCVKVASLDLVLALLGKLVLFEDLMPALHHNQSAQKVPDAATLSQVEFSPGLSLRISAIGLTALFLDKMSNAINGNVEMCHLLQIFDYKGKFRA